MRYRHSTIILTHTWCEASQVPLIPYAVANRAHIRAQARNILSVYFIRKLWRWALYNVIYVGTIEKFSDELKLSITLYVKICYLLFFDYVFIPTLIYWWHWDDFLYSSFMLVLLLLLLALYFHLFIHLLQVLLTPRRSSDQNSIWQLNESKPFMLFPRCKNLSSFWFVKKIWLSFENGMPDSLNLQNMKKKRKP